MKESTIRTEMFSQYHVYGTAFGIDKDEAWQRHVTTL